MELEIIKNPSEGIDLALVGKVDSSTAPVFEAAVREFPADKDTMVFDFSGVEYVSSAGLRVLLIARKGVGPEGKVTLLNVSKDVHDVLDLTGFSSLIDIA